MSRYIPTKEELFELGFEQLENLLFVLYESVEKDIALLYYNHPDDMYSGYLPSFHVNNVSFYPKSKEHLVSIIESFNPDL